MIKLYNTLTREIEPFSPQKGNEVLIYTCGPTVYDYLHIGNWVAYIYWDILVRTLKISGFEVNRVMNITDVGHLTSDEDEGEDKLEKGAQRENKTAWQIAEFYTQDCLKTFQKLNLTKPVQTARATDFIPQQLDIVKTLKEKGYTYQISDGIYFDTSKFPNYADFARLNLSGLKAGARVHHNLEKRNPSDFALWKFTPSGTKRDMEWATPGEILDDDQPKKGFPGWHLECSAIVISLLGETIDIHTGGIDHIPVHHTNEIAQSEAATGQQFSKFWLHNNHLKADGTKISKSLGNGYTIKDIEGRGYSPLDFKMFVLQSHYRTESNFTWENLDGAKARLKHWRDIACLRWQTEKASDDEPVTNADVVMKDIALAINHDLDTPATLRIIDETFSAIDKDPLGGYVSGKTLNILLGFIDELLGLELVKSTPDISSEQKKMIKDREVARDNKDWSRSDEIRDNLLAQNIQLSDTPRGVTWSWA